MAALQSLEEAPVQAVHRNPISPPGLTVQVSCVHQHVDEENKRLLQRTPKINKQGWQCQALLIENGWCCELLEEVLRNTELPNVAPSFVTG